MSQLKDKRVTRREFIIKSAKATAAASLAASSIGPLSGCARIRLSGPKNEVLIKNGTVYDGTLADPITADIYIQGERIVKIGKMPEMKNCRVIDASGLDVIPGFIDIHTHSDLTFKKLGMKRFAAYGMPSLKGNHCYLNQGVTTIVTGNCGYGYTDTAQWLDIVNSLGFGSNVFHLVPHGDMRVELFGKNQPHRLTQKQLEIMKQRLTEEMEKGAIGFSSGLEYAPGLFTPTDELIEMNKVVSRYNRIYATHIRDLTAKTYHDGRSGIEVTLDEAIETARLTGVGLQISHLLIKAPLNNSHKDRIIDIVLDRIDKARQDGIAVAADQFPYPAGQTLLSSRLPVEFKDTEGVKKEFRTKDGMKRVREAIEQRFAINGPENVLIAMCPRHSDYEGRTIQEISEIEGISPSEVYIELVSGEKSPVAIFSDQDINNVNKIMARSDIVTASDAFTIPRNMYKMHPAGYGTFPRRYRQCVTERKEMSPSAAIRTMTSLPAEAFNMKQRGKIAEGYYADIAVIDLQNFRDKATFHDPHQYAEGVVHLFINGVQAMANGKATGNRGGKGLKST